MGIRGSFTTLSIGRNSLLAHRTALDTVGHNLANSGVEGYTRQQMLDGASLHFGEGAPAVSNVAFESLANAYFQVKRAKNRLSRRYSEALLSILSCHERLTTDDLLSESTVQAWVDRLVSSLSESSDAVKALKMQVTVSTSAEGDTFFPVLAYVDHGAPKQLTMNGLFIGHRDYLFLTSLSEEDTGGDVSSFSVVRDAEEQVFGSLYELFSWLETAARKGITVQRYKGLGEMNPDQLWETTMDPDSRNMLKVRVEDAIAADQMFTTLMGDHVDSRKRFIEDNAILAENIDA